MISKSAQGDRCNNRAQPQVPSPHEASDASPFFLCSAPQEPSAQEPSAHDASVAASFGAAVAASEPVVVWEASGPSSDLHAAVTLSAAVAIAMMECLSAEFMFVSLV
jgi:hypothetical protein